jgi:hypothetical protein
VEKAPSQPGWARPCRSYGARSFNKPNAHGFKSVGWLVGLWQKETSGFETYEDAVDVEELIHAAYIQNTIRSNEFFTQDRDP